MNTIHYDFAIIGGSLTARITAALLAKNGNKVLFLRNEEAKAPAWFHSSIFLEKLLGILGGRSCFIDPHPIQVISSKSRLTISNDVSFEDETQREFGDSAKKVHQWLSELHSHGNKLEEMFWENGGLPWPSLKAAARLKLISLKHKVNLASLEAPVTERLNELDGPSRDFVTDVLQGLSLRPVKDLSYARCAMLWAQALRPENLKEPDFSQVLNKRFEQFHGAKEQLDDLEEINYRGSTALGGRFKDGRCFTAQTFLLGNRHQQELFKAGGRNIKNSGYSPKARKTSNLSGQTSKLIGSRIICGGEIPLRIALENNDQELNGIVLSSSGAEEANVRKQLESVLPFADYQMSDVDNFGHSDIKDSEISNVNLSSLPIRIQSNIYCADRTVLLPEMGAAGAAILAWTLFNNLSSKTTQEKG